MAYKPIVLDVFDTFVILRRLDTVSKYIDKKYDITRILAMFDEMFENLSKPDIETDIIGKHKDFLLGYMLIIIRDIRKGIAPQDILDQYIHEIRTYILVLRNELQFQEYVNSLPIEL